MIPRFVSSTDELNAIFDALKHTPCPHCKTIGALIRHGYLRGYDEDDARQRSIRARRLFCNNRKVRNNGCGRTFSVWAAEKIRRLGLHAGSLWKFLKGVAAGQSIIQAFRGLPRMFADRAAHRIWRRFQRAQSFLRTILASLCHPPDIPSDSAGPPCLIACRQAASLTNQRRQALAAMIQVIAHLESAFPNEVCPVSAFQATTQSFFLS